MNSQGDKQVEFAPASYLCFFLLRLLGLPDLGSSSHVEVMPDAPPLQPNLPFHYMAISFSLRLTLFLLSLSSLSIPAATFKWIPAAVTEPDTASIMGPRGG